MTSPHDTARIDDLEKNHRISFQHWATPGATRDSALLDMARTVCRRAERAVVVLQREARAAASVTRRGVVDVLDFDVRLTADGVVVVHHDLQTVHEYFDWVLLLNVRRIAAGKT